MRSATGRRLPVHQRVTAGVAAVTYALRCQVDASDGSRYVLLGLLPVRGA